MPSSIDDDPLAIVQHGPVAVADAVDARDRRPATLDGEAIEGLQDSLTPYVGIDTERMSSRAAGFQNVGARFSNGGKIHRLECPQVRFDRFHGLAQDGLSRRLVDHPELARINARQLQNAHEDLERWLAGDHTPNNDIRPH